MNTVSEIRSNAPSAVPAVTSPVRPLYWSIQRELWENRSIYVAPLAVAAIFLIGFLINTIHLASRMRSGLPLSPQLQRAAFETPYQVAEALIMAATFFIGIFYCLDALYSERRDRSILFWKSLPVSDVTTVLAKLSVPMVILPLITFAIVIVTQWIVRLLTGAIMLGSGVHVVTRWTQMSFFHMSLMMLYHLITVHSLWYAPIFAWLILVSAWARRAPFLWAVLPPIGIMALEKIIFNTAYFAALLKYRFSGPQDFNFGAPGMAVSMDLLHHTQLGSFLTTPGLWTGFLAAAIFLAVAVRLRRAQGPI
jgi:ABC-2 type transport system permease protein